MTIKLYCWVEFGRGDYGEREDELFDISDQELQAIQALLAQYKTEENKVDGKGFTDYLSKHASDIYNRLDSEVKQCFREEFDEYNSEQDDEEDYLNLDDYYFGFRITDDWLKSI
jgi:hypothetical protein